MWTLWHEKHQKFRPDPIFALPDAINPVDLSQLDRDFTRFDLALRQGDPRAAHRHLKDLIGRYPPSQRLKSYAAQLQHTHLTKPLLPREDLSRIDQKLSPAGKVSRLEILFATVARESAGKDFEESFKILEQMIAVSPKDYSNGRMMLANIYLSLGRLDEAEPLFHETYPSMSDDVPFIESFAFLLAQQGKPDEGKEMSIWAKKLRAVYR